MAGDFNAVTDSKERRGGTGLFDRREIIGFNQFITDMKLIDVPVLGKMFTWFSGDRRVRSRLDRFLITEELISNWQIAGQWVGDRDISDHRPIWLTCSVVDWGPKPFRFNNCWLEHKDFRSYVEECWRGMSVGGWKIYVFKEKLKSLHEKLRDQNKEVFTSWV